MALNIKNSEVETLAAEIATLTNETKTEAIRQALMERKLRLQAAGKKPAKREDLLEYLEHNVWPFVPPGELGRVLTRKEEDDILGYGPEGLPTSGSR